MRQCSPHAVSACRNTRGFTLIELMITLVIAAILISMAVPSFRSFTLQQRAKTGSSEIFRALTVARSEALKRNASILLAPVSNDWTKGWSISVGEQTLYERNALKGLTVKGPENFTFLSNGRIAAANTSIQIQPVDSSDASTFRCIRVDPSGRPAVTEGECP